MAKYGKKNPYHPRFQPVDGDWVTRHPLYPTWCNIKDRCQNVDCPGYENYGGRGISMCERWDKSFEYFLEDMGNKPTRLHMIERINNDGNYEPSNCKWASRSEQMLNRRIFSNNESGATGVVPKDGRFIARVDFEKERYNLGTFATVREAEAARVLFQQLLLTNREAALKMTERRARYDSTTGVRGITPHADGGFLIRKTVNKVRVYLGYRKTFEEALALWNDQN